MAKRTVLATTMKNQSSTFRACLNSLAPQVSEGDSTSNFLVVPFVLTCAATLEATLNDQLVTWAFRVYERSEYKRVAEAYLTMSLRGKLDIIVPHLSYDKYIFDKTSADYRALGDLISRRNKLVHSKSFYEDEKITVSDTDPFEIEMSPTQLERWMQSLFYGTHSKHCVEYHNAIIALDELFFYPLEKHELSENSLIKRNKK